MRFHIITEDSKSGYKFWLNININLLKGKARVISAGGIENILKLFEQEIIDKEINTGDYVIVALDFTSEHTLYKKIRDIKDIARESKINIITTTYYCFEEIFLSFRLLTDWVNIDKSTTEYQVYKHIKKCIIHGRDYIEDESEAFITQLNNILARYHISTDRNNREQISAALLAHITNRPYGFKINKSEFGTCWSEDCCNTSTYATKHNKARFNKQCGIENSLTAQEKTRLVAENSVLNTGKLKIQGLIEIASHCE